MTRRMKRSTNYEISLQLKNEAFIRTPRESQRNWLLNQSIREFAEQLDYLHAIAPKFVPGADAVGLDQDRTQADLGDDEIMEDWQIPVMLEMAKIVTESKGDVLEIGFGRGVGSNFIQEGEPRSHTIVECNDAIVARFESWKSDYPGRDISMVHGMWQDVIGQLGKFDGVFFHTYPLNEAEYVEQVAHSSTFAEHFFAVAADHLKPGGAFTYLTNESDSLSRPHQRSLMKHFKSFTVSVLRDLNVPDNTRDAMWCDSMVIVRAMV